MFAKRPHDFFATPGSNKAQRFDAPRPFPRSEHASQRHDSSLDTQDDSHGALAAKQSKRAAKIAQQAALVRHKDATFPAPRRPKTLPASSPLPVPTPADTSALWAPPAGSSGGFKTPAAPGRAPRTSPVVTTVARAHDDAGGRALAAATVAMSSTSSDSSCDVGEVWSSSRGAPLPRAAAVQAEAAPVAAVSWLAVPLSAKRVKAATAAALAAARHPSDVGSAVTAGAVVAVAVRAGKADRPFVSRLPAALAAPASASKAVAVAAAAAPPSPGTAAARRAAVAAEAGAARREALDRRHAKLLLARGRTAAAAALGLPAALSLRAEQVLFGGEGDAAGGSHFSSNCGGGEDQGGEDQGGEEGSDRDDCRGSDPARAVAWAAAAARAGDGRGQRVLGAALRHGLGGLAPDYAAAAAWLERAVLQDRSGRGGSRHERGGAALQLAAILERGGPGLAPSPPRAFWWYSKAAAWSDAGSGQRGRCLTSLARCYAGGVGVAVDKASARRALAEAAEACGSGAAKAALGRMVGRGEGGPSDGASGSALLAQAAAQRAEERAVARGRC